MKRPSKIRKFLEKNTRIHLWVVRILRFLNRDSACAFCDIVHGSAPGRIVFQDDQVTAFWDAHPSAPTHILIVSNRHIRSLNDLQPRDALLSGHLFTVARHLAETEAIADSGYQLKINTGFDGGQTVFHLHMHLRDLSEN